MKIFNMTVQPPEIVTTCLKTSFNKVCPRGTFQRFVITEVVPPIALGVVGVAAVVGVLGGGLYACNYLGHSTLTYFQGSQDAHVQKCLRSTDPANCEPAIDTVVGFITIFASALTIVGTVKGVQEAKKCYATWQKKEKKDIDVEAAIGIDAQAHKTS